MSTKQVQARIMYCDPCGDDREFHLVNQQETLQVRGESVTVATHAWKCPVCAAVQPYMEGTVDSISLAHDEYRRRHGMLTSVQIKRIREQYQLSREAFALLLGMSAATFYRYEAGALQDDVHDTLIAACDDPMTMEAIANRRSGRLSALQSRKFALALQELKLQRQAAKTKEFAREWSDWVRHFAASNLSPWVEAFEQKSSELGEVRAILKNQLDQVPRKRLAALLPLAEIIGLRKCQTAAAFAMPLSVRRASEGLHRSTSCFISECSTVNVARSKEFTSPNSPTDVSSTKMYRVAVTRQARLLHKLHFFFRSLDDEELNRCVDRLVADRLGEQQWLFLSANSSTEFGNHIHGGTRQPL